MTALRFVTAVLVDFGVNLVTLAVSFSIWREFEYRRFSREYWVKAYIGGALFCTAIAAITLAIQHGFMTRNKNHSFWQYVWPVFLVLSTLSISVGSSYPYPAGNWPDWLDRSVGFFTAELQFLRFIICDATVMALCAAALYKLLIGKQSEINVG